MEDKPLVTAYSVFREIAFCGRQPQPAPAKFLPLCEGQEMIANINIQPFDLHQLSPLHSPLTLQREQQSSSPPRDFGKYLPAVGDW